MAFAFTLGDNDGDDYAGLTLCEIDESAPSNNFSGQAALTVWDSPDRYLLLNPSGLAAAMAAAGAVAPITLDPAATRLELYKTSSGEGIAPLDVDVHLLKVAHEPGQATWNERVSAVFWQTPGALGANDYDATALDTVSVGTAAGVQVYDGAALVAALQNLMNGVAGHVAFKIQTSTAFAQASFGTEHGTDEQRPRLVIVGGPTESVDTLYEPFEAAISLVGLDLTIVITGHETVFPARAALALTGRAPTVVQQTPGVSTPAAAAVVVIGRVLTLLQGTVAVPGVAALAATGHAPVATVDVTPGFVSVPGQAIVAFTGLAPTYIRTTGGGPGALPYVFGTMTGVLALRMLDEQFAAVTAVTPLPHVFSVKQQIVLAELDEQFAAAKAGSVVVLPHIFATKPNPIDLNDLDEQFAALLSLLTGPSFAPANAPMAFTGRAPNFAIGAAGAFVAFPAPGAWAFTGLTPTVFIAGWAPGNATTAFTGRLPTVVVGANVFAVPGRAALAFTGLVPTVILSSAGAPTNIAGPAGALSLSVTFDQAATNADGTPLTDLYGYGLLYGTVSGVYPYRRVLVDSTQGTKTITVPSLAAGTYYAVVVAYDTDYNYPNTSLQITKVAT